MNCSIFEVCVLICFGFGWPMAVIKTVRAKNPAGKSYLFMLLVITGYAAGCIHKVIYKFNVVFYLYLLNALPVITDMMP